MKIVFLDKKVKEFLWSLERVTIAKVLKTISLLEVFGHKLGLPHSKHVSNNLFELRICGSQEVRLFYTFYQSQAVILHGFVKKTLRLPAKEINKAKEKLKRLVYL